MITSSFHKICQPCKTLLCCTICQSLPGDNKAAEMAAFRNFSHKHTTIAFTGSGAQDSVSSQTNWPNLTYFFYFIYNTQKQTRWAEYVEETTGRRFNNAFVTLTLDMVLLNHCSILHLSPAYGTTNRVRRGRGWAAGQVVGGGVTDGCLICASLLWAEEWRWRGGIWDFS